MRFGIYKEQAKNVLSAGFRMLRPLLGAFILVLILQATGLISSVSFFGQWALLKTGLKDAADEAILEATDFDYQFTIKDMAGNRISASQFKDKVIFLNLWATWCGPCRAEMEGIQRLYANTHNDKIVFLMLSIDADKDKDKIITYLKKKAFTFPAYQPSGTLPGFLDVPSIPTTFIISREGKIVKKEVGSMRYDTPKFQKFLNDLSK